MNRNKFLLAAVAFLFIPTLFATGSQAGHIEHLVIVKLKKDTPELSIQKIIKKTREMEGKIPEIIGITAGKNFSKRSKGFEIGIVVRLKNKEDIQKYRKHPVHVELVEKYVKPHLEELIVLDYEI